MFTPSHYQQAIFAFVLEQLRLRDEGSSFRHLVVEASAGSGKSASILQCIHRLPKHTRSLVVAFNARVADEMKQKLRGNAKASTLHALGLRAWSRFLAPHHRPDVVADKVYKIIDAEIKRGTVPRFVRFKVVKLVELARQIGLVPGAMAQRQIDAQTGQQRPLPIAPVPNAAPTAAPAVNDVLALSPLISDTDEVWLSLMRRHDLGDDASLLRYARHVLSISIRWGHRFVDFADMLYLPTLCGARFDADADVVFVDELQDLDALQRRMIVGMASAGVLFVGVGDTFQSIYGFRGADSDSMRKVGSEVRAARLPLSITYRCPLSHVAFAQRVCSTIEAAPNATEGLLLRYDALGTPVCASPHKHSADCVCMGNSRRLSSADFKAKDLIICRSKAPLVKAAYSLLRRRVPARILGKDVGRGLLAFVDAQKARGIADLLRRVDVAVSGELARLGEDDTDEAAQEITDRRDVVAAVADACDTDSIEELRDKLESLFSDDIGDGVVTCSTVHKAKGAEADRVWWLDDHKLNLDKHFKHEWKRDEMRNIIFVASTRSRRELRLLPSEFFDRRE